MTETARRSLPHRACRIVPDDRARARGYLRLRAWGRGGEARDIFAPIFGDAPLIARPIDPDAEIWIDAGEAAWEPLPPPMAALSWLRRRFTSLGRAALNFGVVEIVPEGSKRRTRDYHKLVKSARAARMPFDGPFLRAHPELILGWPPEPAAFTAPRGEPALSLAIAAHLHYAELWPELETLLGRQPSRFTLFLTLTRPNDALASRVRARFPDCEIRVVENSGRDVRPFLALLEEGAFDRFDVVCKLHGKRSLRPGYPPLLGELVRRATYLDLIGSAEQAQAILKLFVDRPRVGIVGPERFRASSRRGDPREVMGESRLAIEALAANMGGEAPGPEFDVFAGTMFWARPEALAPLRDLRLAARGFAPEAGRSDGALEHAVEGLINHAVRRAGYEVQGVMAD